MREVPLHRTLLFVSSPIVNRLENVPVYLLRCLGLERDTHERKAVRQALHKLKLGSAYKLKMGRECKLELGRVWMQQ